MSTRKLKRYHRMVHFPEWSEESILGFLKEVSTNSPLKFSLHALEKVIELRLDFGRNLYNSLLKMVKKDTLTLDNVFEFYAIDRRIKKACFRYSFTQFPVDLVIVIAADGVVITVFSINKLDTHSTLDENLYERSS